MNTHLSFETSPRSSLWVLCLPLSLVVGCLQTDFPTACNMDAAACIGADSSVADSSKGQDGAFDSPSGDGGADSATDETDGTVGETCVPKACPATNGCGTLDDGCGNTLTCGGACASPLSCGGSGVANVCGPTYSELTNAAKWTTFDMGSLPGVAPGDWFGGAEVFDGRYVYVLPTNGYQVNGDLIARFDTQSASLSTTAGWQTFDSGGVAFSSGAFDGRYVYAASGTDGNITRYDTQGAGFTVASAWTKFNVTTLGKGTFSGFGPTVYDGHFVYFIGGAGMVARYDIKQPFTQPTAWSVADLGTIHSLGSAELLTATFDGRYMYLAGLFSGLVARYDTQGTFVAGDWAFFDGTTLDANAKAFSGTAFDGQYVYLTPADLTGTALRYDTTSSTFSSGWTTFKLSTLGAQTISFAGATFDGRYVYLVPSGGGPDPNNQGFPLPDGHVVRYDTKGSGGFSAAASWSMFDLSTVNAGATGLAGAVFDGRFVYLTTGAAVGNGRTIARFDARQPPGLPPQFGASFY